MRNRKNLINSIIVAILVIACAIGGFIYYRSSKNNNFIIGETLNVVDPLEYLSKGENGEYYLTKANADIKFKVTTEDEELRYRVIDEEKKEIETIATKNDNYYEIASVQNYEAGKTYIITLENGKFIDEKLADVKKLTYTIVRPNANTQVLNHDVKKVDNKTIIDIEENADNYILISKKEYQKGDIIYYKNDTDIKAFKVDSIAKDNDNYKIVTTTPQLEEIYKELDIYGEFTLNITDFIPNKALEEYVKVAVVESNILDDLFDSLGTTVYASSEELIQVELQPQEDGSIKAVITITLAGNDNPFINLKDMKNHQIKFEMEMTLRLKSFNEINFFKTDVGANIDLEITKTLSIKPKEEYWADFNKQEEKNNMDNLEKAKDILNGLKEDIAKEEQNLGNIYVPTPIAGITINFGIDLVEEFKIAFELNSSETATIHTTFGYKDGVKEINQVGFYWDSYTNVTSNEFKAIGKAHVKLGIRATVQIDFIEIIKVGGSTGVGIYADGQINYVEIKDNATTMDGKYEYGLYIDGKVSGKILNITFAEKTIYDKKWKLVEYYRDILKEKRIEAERKAEEERRAKEEAERKALQEEIARFAGTYYSIYDDSSMWTLKADGTLIKGDGRTTLTPISINKREDGTIRVKTGSIFIELAGYSKDVGYVLYPIGVGGKFDGDKNKLRIGVYGAFDINIYEKN